MPMPKKMTPPEKKQFMEDAVDWLRNNNPNFNDLDGPTADKVMNVPGVPAPGSMPRETKKKAVEDSVDWLRKNSCVIARETAIIDRFAIGR